MTVWLLLVVFSIFSLITSLTFFAVLSTSSSTFLTSSSILTLSGVATISFGCSTASSVFT
jgi:hypothetical protein